MHINRHEVQIEDDILHIRFIGPYAPEEARQVMMLADETYRKHGRVFLLADVTAAVAPGPETRRLIGTWPLLGTYGAVVFGADVIIRTVMRLVSGAQRVLGSRRSIVTHIANTEEDARAWIAEQRKLAPSP